MNYTDIALNERKQNREYVWYDCVCMRFMNRTNLWREVRTVAFLMRMRGHEGASQREGFGLPLMFNSWVDWYL